MTKTALYVELVAKPGCEAEVAEFLAAARPLADAEPQTIAWFALRVDSQTFWIFDAFPDDAGRQAHLEGPIAQALMANAERLLVSAPLIRRADVLADKLPG